MRKNYTALNLLEPHSPLYTTSGFPTIKEAEQYIASMNTDKNRLERVHWLVIETKTLHKHLDRLEEKLQLI